MGESEFTIQLILAFVPSVLTLMGAIVIFGIRDIWMKNEDIKRRNKRDIIEKKLTYLYAPLYANMKLAEKNLGKKSFVAMKPASEQGAGRIKTFIDETIEKYLWLASSRLQPYLVKVHGAGFYHMKPEEADEMLKILEEDYERLRSDFLSLR